MPVQDQCVRAGQRVTGSRRCCAGLVARDGVCTKPDQPPPDPPPPPPPPGNLGSYGNASIDQHDASFLAATAAVKRKKGVTVDPHFIKGHDGD